MCSFSMANTQSNDLLYLASLHTHPLKCIVPCLALCLYWTIS
ncbi:hypothetical protein COLO4_38225 [Corchorus olitorius]|uniref:Uncharacterized protein n=1 Tax=Corchorus olitorius TaxID=93759 RepID=A0A1R3FW90_9ROSI|nr:hypothetical protein COLO4_38225 [Corchorus olitorius]